MNEQLRKQLLDNIFAPNPMYYRLKYGFYFNRENFLATVYEVAGWETRRQLTQNVTSHAKHII